MPAYKDKKTGLFYMQFYYRDARGAKRHKTKKGFQTELEALLWEKSFKALKALGRECVLSSSRRQNRRYDFDTFGVSRADLFFYSRDLPSISAFSILLLAPPNSTSLPWCMMRSMMAEASLSSPNTTPHLLNSIFVVITRLRFS